MLEIKEKVEQLVKKIGANKALREQFLKDPVEVLEKVLKVDLPNEQLDQVADAIKAKLAVDDLGDALGALGGLFGKK